MADMKNYSVASNHPLATRAGIEILEEGGNAYDAVLAVSAALTVVQPHLNGIGGDFFAVVDDGGVRTVNGSGYAADLATPEFFRHQGYSEIPKFGPHASFMIPGIVSSWSLLQEHATMRLPKSFKRAIQYARDGFRVQRSLHRSVSRAAYTDRDWREIYGGISEDSILRQIDLASTLEKIASDSGHSFYHGEIARQIEEDMLKKGGLIRAQDLDSYSAEWRQPLSTRYRGYSVYTTPPNSQGATLLFWMNLLNRFRPFSAENEDYYAAMIQTMKTAYDYRAKYIGDPSHLSLPERILEPDFAYPPLNPNTAGSISLSDTTAFSVYDGSTGISAIQSNYMGFGSGHTVHGTGINLSNRGSYFSLDESHHNCVAPHRKTFHTLMATFCKGPYRIYISSMGGDIQPQTNMQILSKVIDFGYGIQDAISAPRFCYPATIYGSANLFAEKSLNLPGAEKVEDNSNLMGHAQAVVAGDTVSAGFDPRGDAFEKY
jgi:gamma-glutamyltranspeptidase